VVEVLEKVGAGCLKAQQNGNFHKAVVAMENVVAVGIKVTTPTKIKGFF